jgi:hypothetical protein
MQSVVRRHSREAAPGLAPHFGVVLSMGASTTDLATISASRPVQGVPWYWIPSGVSHL